MEEKLKTGTTTVGLVYKGGVVLSADRRVSGGSLVVANMEKIVSLSDRIAMTLAGSVADVQALTKIMRSEIALHEVRSGRPMSTRAAVGLLSSILFNNRMGLLDMGFIVGGYDTKPELYLLDTLGTQIPDKYTSIGSGSIIALGVLENGYKDDMAEEDAIKLAHTAVSTSLKRDVFTGGGVDIIIINKKGYRKLADAEISRIVSQPAAK